MSLHDEPVDLTTLILGLRSEAEALREWPSILGRLGRIAGAVGRRAPAPRRSPRIESAADWLHRSLRDAPIDEDLRAGAEALIGRIKAMVGPVVVKKKLVPVDGMQRDGGPARFDPVRPDALGRRRRLGPAPDRTPLFGAMP
jgi:hypothetical protein